MRVFLLDGAAVEDCEDRHTRLARGLGFPDWYGGNLDALYDCLTDLSEETTITLTNREALEESLGDGYCRFWRVLEDAAEENPYLHIQD